MSSEKGCRQCEFANWFDDRMPKSTVDVNLAQAWLQHPSRTA